MLKEILAWEDRLDSSSVSCFWKPQILALWNTPEKEMLQLYHLVKLLLSILKKDHTYNAQNTHQN